MCAALPDGVRVRPGVVIPEAEIEVRATRSSGPGGQNVNKVATRVEVRFDLEASQVFSAEEKVRLRTALGRRLSADGVVHVASQATRSQARNAAEARARLGALLAAALHVPRRRRATRPTRAGREGRLDAKRRRARLKTSRAAPADD